MMLSMPRSGLEEHMYLQWEKPLRRLPGRQEGNPKKDAKKLRKLLGPPNATEAELDKTRDAILLVCSYHRRDVDLQCIRTRPHEMDMLRKPEDRQARLIQRLLPKSYTAKGHREVINPGGKPLTEPIAIPVNGSPPAPPPVLLDTHHYGSGSLQVPFDSEPQEGLGILDAFPTELVAEIVGHLDVGTYFNFRHVNRRARLIATTRTEYLMVARNGVEAMRALLRGNAGHRCTFDELYEVLTHPTCARCGGFGAHICLLSVERYCMNCLLRCPKLAVNSYEELSAYSKVRMADIESVLGPMTFQTRRGQCFWNDERGRAPPRLVLVFEALDKLYKESLISRWERLVIWGIIQSHGERLSSSRLSSATAYPVFNPQQNQLELGLCCKGCFVRYSRSGSDKDQIARGWLYTKENFLLHFANCKEAKKMWTESENGTKPVEEPEFTRHWGQFIPVHADGLPP